MSPANLIPLLQADALVREIERQIKDENGAIVTGAQREAQDILARARAAARARVHEAIEKLREEGVCRSTRAKARLEAQIRSRVQQRAAQAVRDALPLLREALVARWREPKGRQQWTAVVAQICASRLQQGAWRVEHPRDWSAAERKKFCAAVGEGTQLSFQAADISAGLRVSADQAALDATPLGLLTDSTTIAAMLLDEIGAP